MIIKRYLTRFLVILMAIIFLSGCEYIQELYGDEGVSYVPLGEVPVEGEELGEMPEIIEIIEEEEEVEGEEAVDVIDIEDIVVAEEEEMGEGVTEVEIVTEEVSEEKAIVIIVTENDLVSLVPKASDPDADTLSYTYTSPLGSDGKWQTDYGDAGEYTITVTVSDEQLSSSKDVLLIVNKKEEAPGIDSFSPKETTISIKETESVDFSVSASDLNNDPLSYSWKLDGDDVSDKNSFSYKSTYDDSGAHTVKLDVSDGSLTTTQLWSLSIDNVNREPVLEKIADMTVKENAKVEITPKATDPDGDEITFTIDDPVGDDGVWETSYDDAGEYSVTVTASDGEDEVSQDVKIIVENVNRAPVIVDIVKG